MKKSQLFSLVPAPASVPQVNAPPDHRSFAEAEPHEVRPAPVSVPKFAAVAKRFVLLATCEKRFVVVAEVHHRTRREQHDCQNADGGAMH